MSAVWVRRDEAQRGALPPRCARGGVRCITRYRRPVSDLPAALEWLTWTDLWPRRPRLPAALVALPILPAQQRRFATLVRTRDASAAVLLLAGAVVLLGGGAPARLVALAALVVHLAVAVVGWATQVEVRADATGDWVRLGRVHRDLAEAVEAGHERPRTPLVPAPLRGRAAGGGATSVAPERSGV
jgi:hypothetical protein